MLLEGVFGERRWRRQFRISALHVPRLSPTTLAGACGFVLPPELSDFFNLTDSQAHRPAKRKQLGIRTLSGN